MKEHADYEAMRVFKNQNALEFLERYGAHSIGIRWKTEGGEKTDRLALAFYLDPQEADAGREPVPAFFEFQPTPGGAVVRVSTEIVETPRPDFEESG